MKKQYQIFRHGEVCLREVGKLPKGKLETHNSFVVAHSETGHHHVLESEIDFETIGADKELYFRLFEPAKLVHQKQVDKHRDLVIPAGIWQRFEDTEYDVWEGVIRRVRD